MRLSVDGYLGCFHTLATVNDAVSIVGGIYLFKLIFFFWIYTQGGIARVIW